MRAESLTKFTEFLGGDVSPDGLASHIAGRAVLAPAHAGKVSPEFVRQADGE